MATLTLTLSSSYVPNWGVWEACRELLQNGLDAHDKGYEMEVTYTSNNETLKIVNHGTVIGRDKLILGNTTKADDQAARGSFGEGFKLAWMVLLREGLEVWAKSGDERWVPEIAHSDKFDSEVLKVDTASVVHENAVICRVKGITKEQWKMIRKRMLFLKTPRTMVEVGNDRIIMSQGYEGKLFCKGIFVCQLPDRYRYGYDLADVQLGRDRTMAEPWSLRHNLSFVLRNAVNYGLLSAEEVYNLLNGDHYAEAAAFRQYVGSGRGFERKIAALFREKHGDDAVPVASIEQSAQAEHVGIKGVVTPPAIRTIVESTTGTFEDLRKKRSTSARKVFSARDLTHEEMDNLMWALRTFRAGGEELPGDRVNVVEFHGENLLGTYQRSDDTVRLARRLLTDRQQLIATLVHEVAHRYGCDGSADHRAAIERLFGAITVALSS